MTLLIVLVALVALLALTMLVLDFARKAGDVEKMWIGTSLGRFFNFSAGISRFPRPPDAAAEVEPPETP
ncbi:hypothetical protein D5S17_23320 [Pseudonocardiaceae bacterium YIM PH 21723]|nr:hypothetical protein D5S17_23320 [Pseudonocardiaceae bacterium YIM PH 21723]